MPDRQKQKTSQERNIALLGNPNVGKSTLFNLLTGGKQHTGNWAGKTVEVAQGRYHYKGRTYVLTDLPGTYSLLSSSEEEQIALDYIHSADADLVIIVADAMCLERNITFTLQVMEHVAHILLCVNMMDEAEHSGISIDMKGLSHALGIPVVGVSASTGAGIEALKETVREAADGFIPSRPLRMHIEPEQEKMSAERADRASELMRMYVSGQHEATVYRLDKVFLGRWSGRIAMLLALAVIFWLTIFGANYPSTLLENSLMLVGEWLRAAFDPLPQWMTGLLIDGIYLTTSRVVSVMLPPMLIFFTLFTLLEDLGYLPRAAFLTDHVFERCGSCGKQVLTMSMGFGCNAVGVAGCRIISSPKERVLAIVTNSLVPCNGRFPALIALAYVLFPDEPYLAATSLTALILFSVAVTLISTKLLGKTIAHEKDSYFIMELPPYRKPNLKKILRSAVKERTICVLSRAAMVAAPAGALIWLANSVTLAGRSLLTVWAGWLDPVGSFLGMNGVILLAFILSFPANELLMPLIVMMLSGGMLPEVETATLGQLFDAASWSKVTALCTLVFVMFHWPCSTTCLTIHKETRSWTWTVISVLLPTLIGAALCALINICLN